MLNIYYTSLIPNKTPRKSLNLIFMDIQLPGMDGITALKQLRANPQTKSICGVQTVSRKQTPYGIGTTTPSLLE